MFKENKKISKNRFRELIPYLIIIIVVVLVRSFIITPVNVNGGSMEPTLMGNETMILNKIDLTFNEIERYDIVVVNINNKKLIKRVIGLPGDIIECSEGYIYINNKIITDKYGSGETTDFPKVKLSKNEYYVLGDNREVSKDSRILGPIPRNKILGTTKLVIYPFSEFGLIK